MEMFRKLLTTSVLVFMFPGSQPPNSKSPTPDPKPSTLNPKPQNPNPKPEPPEPQTPNHKPQIRSPVQLACGFLLAFLFLILNLRLKPFADIRLEQMQIWALLSLCLTIFYGVNLFTDYKVAEFEGLKQPKSSWERTMVEYAVLGMQLSVAFLPLYTVRNRGTLNPQS